MGADKNYTKYIKSLDLASLRAKHVWFSPTLRTTELMTDLRHRFDSGVVDERREDAFDVLYIHLITKRRGTYFDYGTLAALYIPNDTAMSFHKSCSFADRRVTFTGLKKLGLYYWAERCLNEPSSKLALSDGTELKLWDTPFLLSAVTEYDKDFRKEWIDGCLVYQGNEYGDASQFHIIGHFDRKY